MKRFDTSLGFSFEADGVTHAAEIRMRAIKALEDAGFEVTTCSTSERQPGLSVGSSSCWPVVGSNA